MTDEAKTCGACGANIVRVRGLWLARLDPNELVSPLFQGLCEASEANWNCECFTCLDDESLGPMNPTLQRMVVCPTCGNKRCPKATAHAHACTNSNEPGQPGSRYA